MSEHEKEEIGTKLTLDDHASEALEKVREGFEKVRERVHETAHEMLGMAKQAAVFAIGFQLNGMIDSVKDFGEEIVHSAIALEEQNKELAGVLAMVDKGQRSFEALKDEAGELNERLAQMGMVTGNSKAAMLDAFELIGEKTTGTADHVEDMVQKMAEAAKSLPGGIGSMATAWRDLESGIVRPRNALVQLMRQMGVVEGTSKQVAKALSAMVQHGQQEKVFAYAEEAIDRMAKRTKEMPLTFGQLMQSMATFREGLFETAGAPIVRALGDEFRATQAYMTGHREEMEALAKTIGVRVAEWVGKAARMIQSGFEYLRDHADDIMNALTTGGAAMKSAVAFMVEHRTLLLALAGAHFAGPSLGKAAGYAAEIAPAIGSALGRGVGGMGGTGLAIMGAARMLPVAAAAVFAWEKAAEQMGKLQQESGLTMGVILKQMFTEFGDIAGVSNNLANFNATMRRFVADAKDADTATEQLDQYAKSMERAGDMAVRAGAMTEDAYRKVMEQAGQMLEAHQKIDNAIERFNSVSGGTGGFGLSLPTIADAYKEMADTNEKAADVAARRMLEANGALTTALGGMPEAVEVALAKLKALAAGKGDEAGTKLPPLNFGPSTFHIQQDFRDQDPDRVVVAFRRDLTRNAVSRIAAKTQGPFGF